MTAREIVLDGGSPWGFRMHGGADVLQPLRISRVNPGSKAAAKGIREGDIITSINGENTRDKTNSEAHALLKGAGNALKLGLNQDCSGGSPKKRQYNNSNRGVQQETHSETIKRSNTTTTTYIVSSNTTTTTSNSTTAKNRANSEGGRPNTISAYDRVGSTKDNNEFNGIKINGESKLTAKDYFSDRSTISSNYSSAASTPSTLTEYQAKAAMPERAKDKWVGMPSEDDPQLVVCLSPTQKSFLETTRKVPDEAAKLLDLHEKFARRRQCHENDANGVDESGMSNRLLAIIRRQQQQQQQAGGVAVDPPKSENPDDYLYYVERGRPGVVPRSNSLEEGTTNDSARLRTHNLSEWLRLARDKSKSDPHLNVFDDTEGIVAVNLPKISEEMAMRRKSLPQEIYVQQMQYLIQKEKEIQRELEKLEEEKRKLTSEMNSTTTTKDGAIQRRFDPTKYHISKNEDIAIHSDELQPKSPSKSTPPSTERFRQDMYDEYMTQIAMRQDRQQNKVIKITTHQVQSPPERAGDKLEVTHVKGIEDEFMTKVKQLKEKYGLDNSNSEDADYAGSLEKSDDAEDSEPVLVMDGDQLSEAKKLPKHLKEFVDIARQAAGALDKDAEEGIWSPGQRDGSSPDSFHRQTSQELDRGDEAPPPVWTPKSAGSSPSLERKEFRPVNFESPILGRRHKSDGSTDATPVDPPWRSPVSSSDIGVALSSSLEKRIPNSFSSPIGGFNDFPSPRLPKAQNPTITLLQKARGGHLPKGAAYIEQGDDPIHRLRHDSPPKIAPGEIVYEIRNEYTSESESERPKKMADLSQRKYPAGIGPTTKDGMPLTLRSEVRDQNQSKWYKRMYDTIHKQKPRYDDDYITVRYKQRRGIWSPGQRDGSSPDSFHRQTSQELDRGDEAPPPVWTPKSAGSSPSLERKEFRPVNFESPILGRRHKSDGSTDATPVDPPWRSPVSSSDIGVALSSSLEKRIPNSFSSPIGGFNDFPSPRLPKAQNPTITLLQKARGGHLPKGAAYIEQGDDPIHRLRHDSPPKIAPGEIVYEIRNEYTSESESERPKKMADLSQRKYPAGIGPTTKDGMPLTLRSEVRDQNQSKWYKRMYDTIHKQKPRYDDDYITVRYKQRRGRYPNISGYLSEPEPGAYDSDASIYDHRIAPLDRRRTQPATSGGGENYTTSYTMPRSSTNSYAPQSTVVRHGKDIYKNQPGRIENYVPGHSSISDKEAKEWWDEVMDIFDGHLEQQKQIPGRGYMSQALKESGYESDSTLVFRRRDEAINQLSPSEQREAYRTIQRGGDVPLHGLRKLAPERPKESPRKYVENEVTIHYRTPVRQEIKEALSEDELQRRQAEHMKKIYQEERRRKYLQVSHSLDELQDMNSRRHADNFIPSQKSPIPLNRYDDFVDDFSPKLKPRPRSPEPRLVAKALYNFVGQSARELTFRKGDIIYIRRQVDKNWYEGEHNAMVGLFPANYVEIVPYDGVKSTVRKPHEGQARAKYNFIAQTHLELSLAKGELVVVTRRVDDNWFEGKIGGRKGIFPVSYVEILIDPTDPPQVPPAAKPVAAPAAHSLLLNGSLGGKESMGTHKYVPPYHGNDTAPSYRAKPVQMTGGGTYGSLSRGKNLNQALHIDTQSDPIPYRALYKYKPQNEDELELLEGDTVYVLEKCDDGWFVGSSDRTGAFGTFPGNYVERI